MKELESARRLGADMLGGMGCRWEHTRTVGARAERLLGDGPVATAAWLHDVGYALDAQEIGFHPLDGANWARHAGFSPEVVSLIAFHSGSVVEAKLRGLSTELDAIAAPDPDPLDMLNFFDMTSGPCGGLCTVEDRVTEILDRYDAESVVHRAVSESRTYLVHSANRGRALASLYMAERAAPGRG